MSELDFFSHAPVAMAVADSHGRLSRVNRALSDLVGYPAGELLGRTLQSLSHPEDCDRTQAALRNLLDGGSAQFQLEQQYIHASGRALWVLLAVSLLRDGRGEPSSFVAHVQDYSERQELARRMAYLADHDPLTGLFTRRRFDETLARHRQTMARYGNEGALLLLDLDRFKSVNDKYGHQAGDDVLKGVASVLRGRVRDTDLLARLGGDEFAIILPQADLARAQVVAGDVVRVLRGTRTTVAKRKVGVTASVGVVAFAELVGEDPAAAADAAMYRAKRAGGDRWMTGSGTTAKPRYWSASLEDQGSWAGRVLGSRGAQAAVGCAALIVTARYGYPSVSGIWTTAHRLLGASWGRWGS